MTPAEKRKAASHLREAFGVSEQRACKAISCCRMTMKYDVTRVDDAGPAREGDRPGASSLRLSRLHVLLKREGYLINHKKTLPALPGREAGGASAVADRERAIGTMAPMMVPMTPNDRRSLDFVSDQLTDGRRFRLPDSGRRLHPRAPGAGRRYFALRQAGSAGVGPADN